MLFLENRRMLAHFGLCFLSGSFLGLSCFAFSFPSVFPSDGSLLSCCRFLVCVSSLCFVFFGGCFSSHSIFCSTSLAARDEHVREMFNPAREFLCIIVCAFSFGSELLIPFGEFATVGCVFVSYPKATRPLKGVDYLGQPGTSAFHPQERERRPGVLLLAFLQKKNCTQNQQSW